MKISEFLFFQNDIDISQMSKLEEKYDTSISRQGIRDMIFGSFLLQYIKQFLLMKEIRRIASTSKAFSVNKFQEEEIWRRIIMEETLKHLPLSSALEDRLLDKLTRHIQLPRNGEIRFYYHQPDISLMFCLSKNKLNIIIEPRQKQHSDDQIYDDFISDSRTYINKITNIPPYLLDEMDINSAGILIDDSCLEVIGQTTLPVVTQARIIFLLALYYHSYFQFSCPKISSKPTRREIIVCNNLFQTIDSYPLLCLPKLDIIICAFRRAALYRLARTIKTAEFIEWYKTVNFRVKLSRPA